MIKYYGDPAVETLPTSSILWRFHQEVIVDIMSLESELDFDIAEVYTVQSRLTILIHLN